MSMIGRRATPVSIPARATAGGIGRGEVGRLTGLVEAEQGDGVRDGERLQAGERDPRGARLGAVHGAGVVAVGVGASVQAGLTKAGPGHPEHGGSFSNVKRPTGAGAGSRYAMGLVIASGMTIGTLFTLYVVPAMYLLLARDYQLQPEYDSTKERVSN